MNKPALTAFLQRWVVTVFAVLVAAKTVSGITYRTEWDLLWATLLLGTLNAFVRPMMLLLSLPLLIFTLGLFVVIINAALLYFVGYLIDGFEVAGFGAAVKGAIVISLVTILANVLFGKGNSRFNLRMDRGPRKPPNRPHPPDGPGPIIDV